jgi:hypothetical protein
MVLEAAQIIDMTSINYLLTLVIFIVPGYALLFALFFPRKVEGLERIMPKRRWEDIGALDKMLLSIMLSSAFLFFIGFIMRRSEPTTDLLAGMLVLEYFLISLFVLSRISNGFRTITLIGAACWLNSSFREKVIEPTSAFFSPPKALLDALELVVFLAILWVWVLTMMLIFITISPSLLGGAWWVRQALAPFIG